MSRTHFSFCYFILIYVNFVSDVDSDVLPSLSVINNYVLCLQNMFIYFFVNLSLSINFFICNVKLFMFIMIMCFSLCFVLMCYILHGRAFFVLNFFIFPPLILSFRTLFLSFLICLPLSLCIFEGLSKQHVNSCC